MFQWTEKNGLFCHRFNTDIKWISVIPVPKQKVEVTNKSVFDLLSRTQEYLQPNPGKTKITGFTPKKIKSWNSKTPNAKTFPAQLLEPNSTCWTRCPRSEGRWRPRATLRLKACWETACCATAMNWETIQSLVWIPEIETFSKNSSKSELF